MNALLRIAGVSKQAMHQYFQKEGLFQTRGSTMIAEADALREVHPGCGVEKMYYILNPAWIGRDRFIALMMELGYGIKPPHSYTRTTYAGVFHFQNLIEGMLLWDRNQLWQSDITYFRVGAGFCYLVFILDVYTKRILGYQANDHMRAEANIQALRMAYRTAGNNLAGVIHHSDRGSQYGDKEYVKMLASRGIIISMGKKPQENAYVERLNGILKSEYLNHWNIASLAELRRCLNEAVAHYNNHRIHGSLPGKTSPVDFEKNLLFLTGQKRPTAIVYADGRTKTIGASSPSGLLPEKTLRAPVCPIVVKTS